MKKIPLTQGKFALVDDEDFEALMAFKWYANEFRPGRFSVRRSGKQKNYVKEKSVSMAREILKPTSGQVVDHINSNPFDNRRKNLRVCSLSENNRNRSLNKNNVSGFKGVNFHEGKWDATIKLDGKTRYLGRYDTSEKAARAYDRAAKKLHGKFAKLNFPL